MVWATVDVNLDDIENDALIDHLTNRGFVVRDKDEIDDSARVQLTAIHEALHLGKQDEAIYLMSNYVANTLGRVL